MAGHKAAGAGRGGTVNIATHRKKETEGRGGRGGGYWF